MELFDRRERRSVLLFLPLMLILLVGAMLLRTRSRESFVERLNSVEHIVLGDSVELFYFDPNTISYDSLLLLGFSKTQSLQLIKYREAGKVYRLAEELHTIYGMDDSLFQRVRPYVVIGESYRLKPGKEYAEREFEPAPRRVFVEPSKEFLVDTVTEEFVRSMGFSIRWSKAFVRVARGRGIRSMEELRELNFVGDSISELLLPYIRFSYVEPEVVTQKVEINRADSQQLCSIYGIGERSASAILKYRTRLGGFYSVEQLSEINEVTESNYEKILKQICVDSFYIQKIDINFAPASRLREHPYITPRILRKLISKRQQRKSKGGWSTVEEMVQDDILTEEAAKRLAPYLEFGTQQE